MYFSCLEELNSDKDIQFDDIFQNEISKWIIYKITTDRTELNINIQET